MIFYIPCSREASIAMISINRVSRPVTGWANFLVACREAWVGGSKVIMRVESSVYNLCDKTSEVHSVTGCRVVGVQSTILQYDEMDDKSKEMYDRGDPRFKNAANADQFRKREKKR